MRKFIDLVENITTTNKLSQLKQQAAALGVDLEVWEGFDFITLDWIERTKGEPSAGAKVMDLLTDYADQVGKPIILDPDGGSDEMSAYYEQWDFETLDDSEVEDHFPDWSQYMRRQPKLVEGVAMQYSPISEPNKRYPIYKNESARTLMKLLSDGQVRGLLDPVSGNVYFWAAYAAVHVTISKQLGLDDPIHLTLLNDIVAVSNRRSQGGPVQDIKMDAVRSNRNIQRIYGRSPDVQQLDDLYDNYED